MSPQLFSNKIFLSGIIFFTILGGYALYQSSIPTGECKEYFAHHEYKKARQTCTRQPEKNDFLASIILGTLYLEGHAGERNYEKAEKLFLQAAQSPDKKASVLGEYELGLVYGRKDYAHFNLGKSASWFKKAADHGHKQSQFMYGNLLTLGRGVDKNTDTATYYLNKALDQGIEKAKITLNYIQETTGVPLPTKNITKKTVK